MERRTSAVPMDFEWQTGKGPVDERSPFHTFAVAQEQQGKKRKFTLFVIVQERKEYRKKLGNAVNLFN